MSWGCWSALSFGRGLAEAATARRDRRSRLTVRRPRRQGDGAKKALRRRTDSMQAFRVNLARRRRQWPAYVKHLTIFGPEARPNPCGIHVRKIAARIRGDMSPRR